jgi:hypothetical protein
MRNGARNRPVMSDVRAGVVWIAEYLGNWPEVDVADLIRRGVDLRTLEPGEVLCWTGLFAVHWVSDDGHEFREGPDDVSVEEAIAWGRSQADVLMLRVGDGDLGGDDDGYFSAGKAQGHREIPVWPEDLRVTARPFQGPWTVWKDGYEVGGGSRIG